MARRRRGTQEQADGDDLFSVRPGAFLGDRLAGMVWPDQQRFPVNHAAAKVRDVVWEDLVASRGPLLVAGFSSIGELVDLLAEWGRRSGHGRARIVLGSEPFASARRSFGAPDAVFTDEVRDYWLTQGISLRLSAKLLQVQQLLQDGRIGARFIDGGWRLHAKVYVGSAAATLGSSNFTRAGLSAQAEANLRSMRGQEPSDYRGCLRIAENYWDAGQPWEGQFADLLRDMLRVVTWREALARACSALLTGEWAERYLPRTDERQALWPSQVAGIAQALWVLDNVGSVLIADATGSGKTRMGAHLVRAVRDRLMQSGRIRTGYTALVAPPGVAQTWELEAASCGAPIKVVSHGKLSLASVVEDTAVRNAQILALDESHNFLNPGTKRTQKVIGNAADHVLLFTATPISRGAKDLLTLVQLLGPDNFDDSTIDALLQLERQPDRRLDPAQLDRLRGELQRFTVRRTKRMLNQAVDADPDAFRSTDGSRINRYPDHTPCTYPTQETADDQRIAADIRAAAQQLRGLAYLGKRIDRPVGMATDDRILANRLAAARGLAQHWVLDSMRSSRAALIEHLNGTAAAVAHENIEHAAKNVGSGNLLATVQRLRGQGPPPVALNCTPPDWLGNPEAWQHACDQEAVIYEAIAALARQLSTRREEGKACLIAGLQVEHPRIIAFDHHPITLAVMRPMVERADGRQVVLATGAASTGKKQVRKALARGADGEAIALCSDALNEGLNLQGASVIVHLDIPTTMRAAEQRVGRIDRMDSPYDVIHSYWPADSEAFATRAAELLVSRAETTSNLLGSNLELPNLGAPASASDPILDLRKHIDELQRPEATWDGIIDALEPVRGLIDGPDALISSEEYRHYVGTRERVLSRVGTVRSVTAWAFFAVAGSQHGAPHWFLLEQSPSRQLHHLDAVTARLRELLIEDPAAAPLDEHSEALLEQFLHNAARLERRLLPRRHQRALEQMSSIISTWRTDALGRGDEAAAVRLQSLAEAADGTADPAPDPYVVAQRWFDLVKVRVVDCQRATRSNLVRLRDITSGLLANPIELDALEDAMSGIPVIADIDTRISACILGVPANL